MTINKDLWNYGVQVLCLPQLDPNIAAGVLGSASINAALAHAEELRKNTTSELRNMQDGIDDVYKMIPRSNLLIEEAKAARTQSKLVLRNLANITKLLNSLCLEAYDTKFVLPQLRGSEHFAIGDEIMIYVARVHDEKKLCSHDWISGKILYPGREGMIHCHTNLPWSQDGGNGGHYMHLWNQEIIFKRSDFYGLKKLLKEGTDSSFIQLLPMDLPERILKGSVEPLSNVELARNQSNYINLAFAHVDFLKQHVPEMAKRAGVSLKKAAVA
jgi:hypothetical protein